MAKVARLTNDGSKIGPGAYNIDEAYKKAMPSPKKVSDWGVDKTKRPENFIHNSSTKGVGPGAYNTYATLDSSIKNPTIPRAQKTRHFSDRFGPRKLKKKNVGSIRANWEEGDSSEDDIAPGPGAHLQHHHTTTFGMQSIVHDHPQMFGTLENRFRDPNEKMKV